MGQARNDSNGWATWVHLQRYHKSQNQFIINLNAQALPDTTTTTAWSWVRQAFIFKLIFCLGLN